MAFDWSSITGNKAFMRAAGESMQDLSYGLARSPTIGGAFGEATMRGQEMQPSRDASATSERQRMDRTAQWKSAIENIRTKYNRPDVADMLESAGEDGINAAWGEVIKGTSPKTAEAFTLGQGQTRYGPDGSVIAQGAPDTPNAPSGYQYGADGGMSFIPGGPADPSNAAAKPPTESRIRNQMLTKVIEPEAARLLGDPATGQGGTFDALTNTGNQAWNAVGLGSAATSPEYQQAQNSLKTIIASYLYATSGATANPGEVENQAAILTPRPGESAQSIQDKKDRLAQMVSAVQQAAYGDESTPTSGQGGNSGQGWEVIGVQ